MRLVSLLDDERQQELVQLENSAPLLKKLNEAAMSGDVQALLGLLEVDPSLLDRSDLLYVSALLGHSSFAHELINRYPKLARQTSRRGSLPLHIAAAKGHLAIVKKLLKVHPEACFVWDLDGRTPLHLAAIKGHIGVLRELVRVAPESAKVMTKGGESALHLCVKHNRLEALKVLVECTRTDDVFLNRKDFDGNSALHVAVEKKQLEIVKYFLRNIDIDTHAKNAKGFTTLDVLRNGKRDVRDMEIKSLLQGFRSSEVQEPLFLNCDQDTVGEVPELIEKMAAPKPRSKKHKHIDWLGRKRNALMVVASLIATVAFQGTLSPPGGFWQNDFTANPARNGTEKSHSVGMAVMATTLPTAYGQYIIFNTLAFLSSLSIILLLISGLPMNKRRWMWTLMITMWIAITALTCTYFIAWIHMTPKDESGVLYNVTRVSVILWLCMMGIVFVGNMVRVGRRLLMKYGYLKEEEQPSDTTIYLEDEENDDL